MVQRGVVKGMAEFSNLNAGVELLNRNLRAGRGDRVAVIDKDGSHTFGRIAADADRFGNLLLGGGVHPEQRVLLALEDSVAFHVCFLGALRAGMVPVPLNTMLTAADYAFIYEDSRASALVASPGLVGKMPDAATVPKFCSEGAMGEYVDLNRAMATCDDALAASVTRADDVAFWLYTSGTTGRPKGVMHSHSDLLATAEHYGQGVLHLNEEDVVFSAAKLFFAYGLGNSLTFPLASGATAVLLDSAPMPQDVKRLIDLHRPTVFFGVPTLFAMLLNTDSLPAPGHRLRVCVSAGESLPEAVLSRWLDATGIEVLDGLGSTEMLHIYLSNRPGQVQPGTSGSPVPGYEVKLVDEEGAAVEPGEMGDLYAKGPSMCQGYWNRRELNLDTFNGHWMRTGDRYRVTESGAYAHCGRSDDMLKVGGIYVSPMEVENTLLQHPSVAEVAVVGAYDQDRLIKPKAFVVLARDVAEGDELARELIDHTAARLATFKRPRWVEFVADLPKTATGKIQRFKLR